MNRPPSPPSLLGAMLTIVNAVKAKVKNGRLVVDEATDLPEGTELYLVPAETDDDMDDEERAKLYAEGTLMKVWQGRRSRRSRRASGRCHRVAPGNVRVNVLTLQGGPGRQIERALTHWWRNTPSRQGA